MSLKNILVAADLNFGSEAAVLRAAKLPLDRGATLTILNVIDPEAGDPESARRLGHLALEALAGEVSAARRDLEPVEVLAAQVEGVPAVEIAQHARGLAADLIVVGHHHAKSWLERLFHSTAERVLAQSLVPLLMVVRTPDRPYRSLLHAHDLKATCDASLSLALRVVDAPLPAVTVVHAWQLPWPILAKPARFEGREAARRLAGKQARENIARDLASLAPVAHDWTVVVREGKPGPVIVEEAVARRTDLISMGTLARSGVGRALFGSVAAYVVRHAPCDVLIARP